MRFLALVLLLSFAGTSAASAAPAAPQLIKSSGNDFHLYRDQGRYYVLGSREARDTYLATGQVPYALILPGAGPMGETVVFGIEQGNPRRVEDLQKDFADTEIAFIFH